MTGHRQAHAIATVWTAVALVVTAGCSLPVAPSVPPSAPEVSAPAGPAGSATAQPAPSADSGTSSGAASPTPSATPTQAGEQPVAARRGVVEEYPVEARVYPVHRTGGMSTINIDLQALSPDDVFSIRATFNDGNPEVSSRSNTAPDGIKLVDAARHRVYLAASTANGDCLCQPAPSRIFIERANQVWLSVSFAAPPSDVRAVDVIVPQFGTFNDVPVV